MQQGKSYKHEQVRFDSQHEGKLTYLRKNWVEIGWRPAPQPRTFPQTLDPGFLAVDRMNSDLQTLANVAELHNPVRVDPVFSGISRQVTNFNESCKRNQLPLREPAIWSYSSADPSYLPFRGKLRVPIILLIPDVRSPAKTRFLSHLNLDVLSIKLNLPHPLPYHVI